MPASISPLELARLVGSAGCPHVVDVRRQQAYAADGRRIAGALWRDHMQAGAWSHQFDDGAGIVVYCSHGHNVSQIAGALIAAEGIDVRVLAGGIDAYAEAGGLTIDREGPGIEPGLPAPSVWVTRERPKIDRIACPWLIRRFIDPHAVFHFVTAEWVKDVADELGAIAYDIESVHYSHRGELCSFDTILESFGIADPALLHLARIVRGADTARPDLEPEAAGLLALSLGLSATETDDLKQLEKGMILYDALYGWCRFAMNERHNWPAAKVQA
jgi:rhodanese-related sulfurtransferase